LCRTRQVNGLSPIDDLLAQGLEYHRAGDIARAEEFYRQALALDSSSAEGWVRLGTACLGLRHVEEAVKCLQQGIALQPDHFDAYNNLGVALDRLGQEDEALACYQ